MKKTCFVVCPIGDKGTPINDHSNRLLEMIIEKALPRSSWETVRADQAPFTSERITTDILEKLRTFDFCVVDITEWNPNVMFELGVRFELGLDYMVVARKGTKIPFDIKDIRVLLYDLDDAKSVGEAVGAIGERGRTILSQEHPIREKQAEKKAPISAKELEIVAEIAQRLNAILDSDAAWEKGGDGKWNKVEFRYTFGMYWKKWREPARLQSDNATAPEESRWPGHKQAILSRTQKSEYGIDWPGVVYEVTPGSLCVASRLVQEYALWVFHIARCLHHRAISEESARYFWRAIDLAFPLQLLVEPYDTNEYDSGFWRWVEFMVFGNTADKRLSGTPDEKRLPWIELFKAIKGGKNLVDHH